MTKRFARLIAATVSAMLLLTTGGCALSALTAENVMEPPQAFGDGAELQAALERALGPQMTLRYPRSGEHRSAVVRADVDNDSLDEAIVFYRRATESAGARMVLMDTDENENWTVTGEFSEATGEIDRVVFGDIDGDGVLDIITGWMEYSDYGTLHVHSCRDGTLRQLSISTGTTGAYALSSYAEMAVGDFDADGSSELMTVSMAGTDDAGEARMLKWVSGGRPDTGWISQAGRITLRPGAAEYTGSAAGRLAWGTYGLVVDSRRADGSYSSEVILWSKERRGLDSPAAEEGETLFRRTLATESCDIDGDGFIEIPGDRLLPDCDEAAAQKIYLTDWYRYTADAYVPELSAIMRPDSGYYFSLPDSWQDRVTAQPDNETHSLHFYSSGGRVPFSGELMSLRVFTMDEWDEERSAGLDEADPGYVELCTTDYYVYAVKIIGSPPGLDISYDSVLENFSLMV